MNYFDNNSNSGKLCLNLSQCILKKFDFFAPKYNMNLNRNTKTSTCLGFFLSIITFSVFFYLLYFELKDVLAKKNPIVFSYTDVLDSFKYSNEINRLSSFFILQTSKRPDSEKNYFYFLDPIYVGTLTYNNGSKMFIDGRFSKCTEEQIAEYKDIPNFNHTEINAENFCPQDFPQLKDVNSFYYDIFLYKCNDQSVSGCTYNKTFNEAMSNKSSLSLYPLYLINKVGRVDVGNYDPYKSYISSYLIYLGRDNNAIDVVYDTYNIISKSIDLFGGNKQTVFYNYVSMSSWSSEYPGIITMKPSLQIHTYVRQYKSYGSALAHCFSFLKIIKFFATLIIHLHCKFVQNEIIIKNVFFNKEINDLNNSNSKISINEASTSRDMNSPNLLAYIKVKKLLTQSNRKSLKLNFWNKLAYLFTCFSDKNKKLDIHESKNRLFKYLDSLIKHYTSVDVLMAWLLLLDIRTDKVGTEIIPDRWEK